MHHQNDQAGQYSDDVRHPAEQGHKESGIGHSIRPATAVPLTVLVAEMLNGSVVLQGWRDGPTAYLCPEDAVPLKRELAAAFGSTALTRHADDG